MTHMHIPTTPPPRDKTPRHKRTIRGLSYLDADPASHAACTGSRVPDMCQDTFCPRHEPRAYASHMAAHATDSVR